MFRHLGPLRVLLLAIVTMVFAPACAAESAEDEDVGAQWSPVERSYFDALERAVEDAKGAQAKVEESKEALSAELATVYLALTPQEVQKYTLAFHNRPENREAREAHARAVRAAAAALLTGMRARDDVKPELLGYTKERIDRDWLSTRFNLSVRSAKAVYATAVLIANADAELADDQLPAVLRFAGRIFRDRTFRVVNADGTVVTGRYREVAALGAGVSEAELDKKIDADIVVPALVNRTMRTLSDKGEAPAVATTDIETILEPLAEAPHLFEGLPVIRDGVQKLLAARGGQVQPAVQALASAPPSKFLTGIGAVSVVASLWQARNAWMEDDWKGALQNSVHAVPHLLETLASIAKYSNTRLLNAALLGRMTARLEPIIGLAITALETYEAWKEFREESNVGTGLSFGGGLLSCAGFAMMLFPPAATAGVVVLAVGTAVRFLGEWVASRIEAAERRARIRQTLQGMGFSQALANTLVGASARRMGELGERLRLAPAQVRALATEYPSMITNDANSGYPIEAIADVTNAFRGTSNGAASFDTVALVRAIGNDRAVFMFSSTVTPVRFGGYPPRQGAGLRSQWVTALRNARGYAAEVVAGAQGAATYLEPLAR
ncbi:MAG: hypothetical protein JST00_06515 [Deltaproteobacteria bacterium]|nr:hypothetical protein [Deltaproteobacteria bacterium]